MLSHRNGSTRLLLRTVACVGSNGTLFNGSGCTQKNAVASVLGGGFKKDGTGDICGV